MNSRPKNEVLERHPVPKEWETGDQEMLLNASTVTSSVGKKKTKRTFISENGMGFGDRKPAFDRKRAPLQGLEVNERLDTSPEKETRIAHAPPNVWSNFWGKGTKSEHEKAGKEEELKENTGKSV